MANVRNAETQTVRLFGPAYQRATQSGATGSECAVCGKQTDELLLINVDNGPENFGENMGWHPIGPDCAKMAAAAGWEVGSVPTPDLHRG